MKTSTAGLIAVAVIAIALIGFTQARHSGKPVAQADSPADVVANGKMKTRIAGGVRSSAKPGRPVALPTDLDTIDGRDFVDALPQLEQRARGGDMDAARVLFRRLQECVGYRPESDAEIREAVDQWYEQQLETRKRFPDLSTEFVVTEQKRQQELDRRLASRERCAALTPAQIGRRLDWAQWMVEHGDRHSIIAFAGVGQWEIDANERIRYAEQLARFAELEQAQLDRFVEACDIEVLNRLAFSRSTWTPLFAEDDAQAYQYAWAITLADPSKKANLAYSMSKLEDGKLTADQVAQAKVAGQALYERACRKATGSG